MAQRKPSRAPSRGIIRPRFGWRVLLFGVGVLTLPLSLALVRTLFAAERSLGGHAILGLSASSGMFVIGFLLFALTYIAFPVPAKPYIFGHELTHALFGLAQGAKVSHFRVKKEAGSVKVSEGGVVVLLAPYFFPIYMVTLLLLLGGLSLVIPIIGTPFGLVIAGLVGITWSFHFCFTINGMMQRQSDLEIYGFFFSFALILLLNLLILCLVFVAISPYSFQSMSTLISERTESTLLWLWDRAWRR